MSRKVVVLGGGLAGLSAAYQLSKNPKNKVLVFEKEKNVGGLARTINYKGFLFEFGPHRFFTKNSYIEGLVKHLLGDELRQVYRQTRIYFEGNLFNYPPKFFDTIKLGWLPAFRIFLDYLYIRIKSKFKEPKIKTLEDAYINQFGRSLYKIFFEDFSEKLWGLPCSQISADWAAQRTRRMSITKVLSEMLFKKKEVVSLVDRFYFPKKGIGRLAERLAGKTVESGGKIFTKAEVLKVNTAGKKVESVEVKLNGKKKKIKADYFISTLPITAFIRLLSPVPSEKILKATGKLKFRDLVLVNLIINKKSFSPDHWIYTQGPGICNRIIQPKNFSKDMVPDKNKTSLSAEYTVWEDDKISDRQYVERTIETLTKTLGFVKKGEVLDSFVLRARYTYPVYTLSYKKDTGVLKKYLKTLKNFQTTGRSGLFRYNNMDHAILSGLYAARNLEGEKHDLDRINVEKEYLEEKRTRTSD